MGAVVHGYALAPLGEPNAFAALSLSERMHHEIGDVRDEGHLRRALLESSPEVVFHLAAQPFVRESYRDPVGTFDTNVMGTVNLLNATREAGSVRAVVVVTSDKCYENREWVWGYREGDPLGGRDPYSSSKACAEIVTAAFRASFFEQAGVGKRPAVITSVRAGNVLGGGDWGQDRIVPDAVRAFVSDAPALVRNPTATRPWQHLIDPLRGYLMLAERSYEGQPWAAGPWNLGPNDSEPVDVGSLVTQLATRWGDGARWERTGDQSELHEAHSLQLYSTKARTELGWRPHIGLDECLDLSVDWYKSFYRGDSPERLHELTLQQIARYGMTP
jgi:CDP-glucose 4,6-dehydratase